jgi:hypothetical protein
VEELSFIIPSFEPNVYSTVTLTMVPEYDQRATKSPTCLYPVNLTCPCFPSSFLAIATSFSPNSRAGHSLLFPLFAIRSSATSTPLFAIATPLLFRKLQYATRYRYFCFISVADCINFRAISSVRDPQH